MIAFTCSGTWGHIYPAIAVAQHHHDKASIFIVEQDRLAAEIVPKYGFNCAFIRFKPKNILSWFSTFFRVAKIFKSNHITRLISTGGYATIPVVMVAWLFQYSVTLLEQNTIPGRANRFLAFLPARFVLVFQHQLTLNIKLFLLQVIRCACIIRKIVSLKTLFHYLGVKVKTSWFLEAVREQIPLIKKLFRLKALL